MRRAVFSHPGRCYRSGVTFERPLEPYLWRQTTPSSDTRFEDGFAVYDAAELWGPWTTVYFAEQWDVGPREKFGIPAKWISDDGAISHLVFSGDDCFSVRRGISKLPGKVPVE